MLLRRFHIKRIIKWAKNKVKKYKDYKVYVYRHRDLIYNN